MVRAGRFRCRWRIASQQQRLAARRRRQQRADIPAESAIAFSILQEFKVLSYVFSAEYGTRAGPAVLLVTTKSGTNQLHGSVFEFSPNTSLDARSYFSPSREKFNLNQFGAAIGGPIGKDKAFFCITKPPGSGWGFHTRVDSTQAMIGGDFSNDPLGLPCGVAQAAYNNQILFPT